MAAQLGLYCILLEMFVLPSVFTPFTPVASLVGGILIGLSAVIIMAMFGRVAGIVGITTGTILRPDKGWRVAFLVGLIAAPLAWSFGTGALPQQSVSSNLVGMAIAGLFVGVGTALGSGCTSGHGVCGLARLSKRSMAAVATFMVTALATVFVLRHVVGG